MSLSSVKKFAFPAALFCLVGACSLGIWKMAEVGANESGQGLRPTVASAANTASGPAAASPRAAATANTGSGAAAKAADAPPSHSAGGKKKKGSGSPVSVDCDNLPTREEFLRRSYLPETVRNFQKCLKARGFYAGNIDGIAGPLTLAALGGASAAGSSAGAPFPADGPPVVYSLTKQDLEELKTFNKIVEQLQQLDEVKYENGLELRTAVNDVIEEAGNISGDYRVTIAEHLDKLKQFTLSQKDFLALDAEQIPKSVVEKLRELRGQHYASKDDLVLAVEAKLDELQDPEAIKSKILEALDEVAAVYFLPEEFFMKLEDLRVPDEIVDLLKKIEDVEYPNKQMFLNTLEKGFKDKHEKGSKDLNSDYKDILLKKAAKSYPFKEGKQVNWSGSPAGCYMKNFSNIAYAFYPYWMAGDKQSIDFSSFSRIGYFAVSFDDYGNIVERRHWAPKYADFINQARRYRTAVDLVFYKNNWDNWARFISVDRTEFVDRLTTNMVEAVSQKLTNTLLNRMMPVVSLGVAATPTMGDGITIFFEGYPRDEASITFLKKMIATLRAKLDAAAGKAEVGKGFRFSLNLVLQYDEREMIKHLGFKNALPSIHTPPKTYEGRRDELSKSDVDYFLVFLEEPTTDTKKDLRKEVEEKFSFFGDFRSVAMRRIVPVLVSGILHRDDYKKGQFEDDIAYFQDNFGGAGFWPVPTGNDEGAAHVAITIKKKFTDGNSDFFQRTMAAYVPSFVRSVGAYRWELRIVRDLLLAVIVVCAILSYYVFDLQAFLRKHYLWTVGVVAATLLIQMSLLLEDPSLREVTTVILLLTVIVGAGIGVFLFIGKARQADLP